MNNEQPVVSKRELIKTRINSTLFEVKDIVATIDQINLFVFRKNMVTKVVCTKTNTNPPFTFLFAVSYFNNARLLEIVKAGLASLGKSVNTQEILDESFVNNLSDFLQSTKKVSVQDSAGYIRLYAQNNTFFDIITDKMTDKPSASLLIRAICFFLSMCGKTVSSNLDEMSLNDYGCITLWKLENEFTS